MSADKKLTAKVSDTACKSSTALAKAESFICVWLDLSVNTTQDNQVTQKELRNLIATLQTFTSDVECETYIKKMNNDKLVLITSGGLGRRLVPRIHDLPQVSSIYIYCQDKQANEPWASKHSKVLGVHVDSVELIANVATKHQIRLRRPMGPMISILSKTIESMETRNAQFLWLQLFIEVLLRMNQKKADRQELMKLLRAHCKGNANETKIIEEFEKDYKPCQAIRWYTRESCIYRLLNDALRQQCLETLIAYRGFLSDMAVLITKEHEKFIRTNKDEKVIDVYRGQVIPQEELTLIKENVGNFISMNSFLSTSRQRKVALPFAREGAKKNPQAAPVLFKIRIDLQTKTKAFANIKGMSCHKEEDEVLIMLGALFRIDEVLEDMKENITVVHLSLADEDEFELKDILDSMKEEIDSETNLDSLGKLLLRMGENQRAHKCYERMVEESLITISNARLGLGWANLRCDNTNESLQQFEEVLAIRQKLWGKGHPGVGQVHSFLGEAHLSNQNYKEALRSLLEAIQVQEKDIAGNGQELASSYDSVGTTYTCMGNFDLAFEHYQKALKLREKILKKDDPQIGVTLKNIGWMFEKRTNFVEAIGYFQRALDIFHKALPPNHHYIKETNEYINTLRGNLRPKKSM